MPRQIRILEGFPGQRLEIVPPGIVRRAATLPVVRCLFPTHLGRFDAARHHYVDRRQGTPEHIFIACLAGAGRCWIRKTRWDLTEGHAIVLPPHIHHRYQADETRPWTIFWIHFVGSEAQDYCQAMNVSAGQPRFWIADLPQITAAFEEVYSYVLGGFTDNDLLGLSTATARLFGLCRYFQRSPDARRRETEERVVAAIRFMQQNVSRTLQLRECADRARWSSPHFNMVFKRHVNIPPMKFFARLKTTRACELLKTTDLTVREIAAQLGFEDPFYFSRFFRRHQNISPSRYRKESFWARPKQR